MDSIDGFEHDFTYLEACQLILSFLQKYLMAENR